MEIEIHYNKFGCILFYKENGKWTDCTDYDKIMKYLEMLYDLSVSNILVACSKTKIKVNFTNGNCLILSGNIEKLLEDDRFLKLRNIMIHTKKIMIIGTVNRLAIAGLAGVMSLTMLTGLKEKNNQETLHTNIIEENAEHKLSKLNNFYLRNEQLEQFKFESQKDMSTPTIDNQKLNNTTESEDLEIGSLDERIAKTSQLQKQGSIIGSDVDEYMLYKYMDFIESENGKKCFKLCETYGLDPYLMLALFMNESSLNHEGTLPGGEFYNGYAVGIGQIETPPTDKVANYSVIAYNYKTGKTENKFITMDDACNIEDNMQYSIMNFHTLLEKYNGNIKLALQAYNYGEGVVNLVIQIYADEIGKGFYDVIKDFNDMGWMPMINEICYHPQEFASRIDIEKYKEYTPVIEFLLNWSFETYGNCDYISDVFSKYLGQYSFNIIKGKKVSNNLNKGFSDSLEKDKTNKI